MIKGLGPFKKVVMGVHRQEDSAERFLQNVEKELGEDVHRITENPASVTRGIVGNVMEWYDFSLYGYMVPIISMLFFPGDDPLLSILSAFAVFAVGFFMRPLGGLLFGHLGDVRGRKITLYLSLVMMGTSTTLMGLLPVHATVGILAPVLLVLLRVLQGISVGGEFSSSVTYLVEQAPQEHRGFFGSMANIGSMGGMLLGALVATGAITLLPDTMLYDWGWRPPFLLSGVLAVIGIRSTTKLPETHMYLREKRHEHVLPLRSTFREGKREMLAGILFSMGYAVLFYIPLVYMPTYLNSVLGMKNDLSLQVTVVVTILLIILLPLMAMLSDHFIRRRTMLLIAFGAALLLTIPLFLSIQGLDVTTILLAELLFAVIIGVPLAIAPSTFVEMFPTEYRLTAYSVIYNVGLGIFGGSAPLISTWLIEVTGDVLAPAYYLCVMLAISIVGLSLIEDRSREPLR